MPILSVQNGPGDVVIRVVAGANESYAIGGNTVSNSTVQTFVTAKDASENLFVSATRIKKILYNSDSVWTIGKTVNSTSNVALFKLAGYGIFDIDAAGMCTNSVSDYPQCNIFINCASSNGTLMLKIGKVTAPSEDFDPKFISE